jgi:phage-related protein
MLWTVETLNAAVDAEIAALPLDMRARLSRFTNAIAQIGFVGLPHDAVKHLEDKLWELRITGRDGISRAIYVTASGRRVVIVRVFIKKTQKTPKHELELARQRAKEVR